jgi:uroporphyrinogen III methyltransferase/synthase
MQRILDKDPVVEGPSKKKLAGKRIVNTRAKAQARELSDRLRACGAEVIELPTIEIVPASPGGELDREISALEKYEWLLFTSTNSVDVFIKRVLALRYDLNALKNIRIASIGPGTTGALEGYKIKPTLTARDSVGEGFAASLREFTDWNRKKVLLPRAEKARDIVPDTLSKLGADLTVVTVYRTVATKGIDRSVVEIITTNRYDCIAFTSSSTFENLVKIIGHDTFEKIKPVLKAASIGPATSETIREAGIEPIVEAEVHTISGLVEAIAEYFVSI